MKILPILIIALLSLWIVPVMVEGYTITCNDYDANAGDNVATCNGSTNCYWAGGNLGCEPKVGQPTQEAPPEEAPTVVTTGAGLITLIEKLGNWVFSIVLAIAGVFLIYAGFQWITAGGDPEKAKAARQMVMNSLIGVAIALVARGLVQAIKAIIAG